MYMPVSDNLPPVTVKMDRAKGRQEKRSRQYICTVCNKDPLLI